MLARVTGGTDDVEGESSSDEILEYGGYNWHKVGTMKRGRFVHATSVVNNVNNYDSHCEE